MSDPLLTKAEIKDLQKLVAEMDRRRKAVTEAWCDIRELIGFGHDKGDGFETELDHKYPLAEAVLRYAYASRMKFRHEDMQDEIYRAFQKQEKA